MVLSQEDKAQIARVVAAAEAFNDDQGRVKRGSFIGPAQNLGLITRKGIAKHFGIQPQQVTNKLKSVNDRDLRPLAALIVSAGKQRLE